MLCWNCAGKEEGLGNISAGYALECSRDLWTAWAHSVWTASQTCYVNVPLWLASIFPWMLMYRKGISSIFWGEQTQVTYGRIQGTQRVYHEEDSGKTLALSSNIWSVVCGRRFRFVLGPKRQHQSGQIEVPANKFGHNIWQKILTMSTIQYGSTPITAKKRLESDIS